MQVNERGETNKEATYFIITMHFDIVNLSDEMLTRS